MPEGWQSLEWMTVAQHLLSLTLIVGKSKWNTKDSSSGMVLRTVLPVTTQRVWEVLFLLKVFCGA